MNGQDALSVNYTIRMIPAWILTKEILEEEGVSPLMRHGFKAEMQKQRENAQEKAVKVTNYMGAEVTVYDDIDTSDHYRICQDMTVWQHDFRSQQR